MRLLTVAFALLAGCITNNQYELNMPVTNNDGLPVINDSGNPGKSVVIRPNPLSPVNAASLALVPAPVGSPVDSATLLGISGDDKESEVVSVTLDNPNPNDRPTQVFTDAILARPFAKLEWGVGGIQSEAEVDYDHGLSLSIPCSYLRVTGVNEIIPAKVANLQGAGPDVFARNVRLGAFCGFGSVAGTKNLSAKRTVYFDNPADITYRKIPAFATNMQIYRDNDTAPFVMYITDESGTIIAGITYPISSNYNQSAVDLPNDAAFIIPGGPLPVSISSIRAVFGLSF